MYIWLMLLYCTLKNKDGKILLLFYYNKKMEKWLIVNDQNKSK